MSRPRSARPWLRACVAAVALLSAACTAPPRPSVTESPTTPPVGPSVGGSPLPAHVEATRPNVVVLLTDDQAFTLFDRNLMPNVFSRIVDQGVDFTRAYVNNSQCCPSRSSILTGLYSHNTGVDSNTVPLDGQTPPRPVFPLALQQAGYRTGLFGKYLNSEDCSPRPGWSRWVCGTKVTEIHPRLNIDGAEKKFDGFTADILANYAIDFIKQDTDPTHRFFVYYAPKDPHTPANDPRDTRPIPPARPPSFNAQPDQSSLPQWAREGPLSTQDIAAIDQKRAAMARQLPPLDADIGRILDALQGRAADTLVIFLSDNGYLYGEHRETAKNVPYEESVRVPFAIRYPRLLPPARHYRTDALISNVDIAPTIMQLAGIAWDGDGVSLVPLLTRTAATVREALLIEWCEAGNNPKCATEDKPGNGPVPPFYGVETAGHVYIRYRTNEEQLYDLRADPYELRNLAGDPASAGLKASLGRMLDALVAPPPTPGTTIAEAARDGDTAFFVFFSQARTTTFRCSLRGPGHAGAWRDCPGGTVRYPTLASGTYTFAVRAVDAAGHVDPTPATRAFIIP